ncbi:MCM binding protein [Schizosaccharomyces japonicus yFS275]|uniref:MCM binding protein n=1 Tax=Schizosaccharomyces japonicus (strain yFS275 / FY16936) TaxID=402676 RepID=B6JWF2_SCHJY|nr:MCM binding protein [Schizosaccharomyces japonicus yFS275]EEB05703.1 MCM binding protein [Schizosaccharomyces japonicus yFS275]
MVSSQYDAFLSDPCGFLQKLQNDVFANQNTPNFHTDFNIPQLIKNILQSEQDWNKIPSLQKYQRKLQDGQLVQLECMVQDTNFGHEFYVGAVKNTHDEWKSCRYSFLEEDNESERVEKLETALDERYSIYVTSIPGQEETYLQPISAEHSLKLDSSSAYQNRIFHSESIGAIVKCYGGVETEIHVCDALRIVGLYESPSEYTDDLPVVHMLYFENISNLPLRRLSPLENKTMREQTLAFMTRKLGDPIAAETLLLTLFGNVFNRTGGSAIGCMSLNLTNCNTIDVANVVSTLKQVCPRVYQETVSIERLNSVRFYPSSDGESLSTGVLQVSPGTVLVLDETQLNKGILNDTGVRNIAFLEQLITEQMLPFMFPFSQFEVPTNLRIVILSQTKSLLPSQVLYKYKKPIDDKEHSSSSSEPLEDGLIPAVFDYISQATLVTRIPDDVSKHIQDAFVQSRREGKAADEKTLGLQINASCLMAKSWGRNEVSYEDFDFVCDLFEHWSL